MIARADGTDRVPSASLDGTGPSTSDPPPMMSRVIVVASAAVFSLIALGYLLVRGASLSIVGSSPILCATS